MSFSKEVITAHHQGQVKHYYPACPMFPNQYYAYKYNQY